MKFLKSDVVAVCEALDFHTASKWNRKRMAKQVRKIAESRADDELEIGEDAVEDDAERERLMGILDKLSKAEEIEFVVDKADLDDVPADDSSVVEPEPDEPVVDSTDDESEESESEPDDSESAVEPEPEEEDDPEPVKEPESVVEKPKRGRHGRRRTKEEKPEKKTDAVKVKDGKKAKQKKRKVKSKKDEVGKPKKKVKSKKDKPEKTKKKTRGLDGPEIDGDPAGIRSICNRLFYAGRVLRDANLSDGLTDELVQKVDALCAKSNLVASKTQLGYAWHVINGYCNG